MQVRKVKEKERRMGVRDQNKAGRNQAVKGRDFFWKTFVYINSVFSTYEKC